MSKLLKVKKIIMLGNSKKFFELASNLFKNSVIVIIPWRKCSSFDISRLKFSPDLIIICGYDYMSSWYSYNKYLEINVYNPLNLIKKIMNSKTIVFYADTINDNSLFTFSRYRYAKRLLGIFLNKLDKQFKYIYFPVFIYNDKNVYIYGGIFTRFIFNFLISVNAINFISLASAKIEFIKALHSKSNKYSSNLKPKFLNIRRPLFCDRALRLICG